MKIKHYEPNLDPNILEKSRAEFAAMVASLALNCTNNRELLTRLERRLPKGFLEQIGEGTTRRVYATPLGVVVKLQRESVITDPLCDVELEERGGNEYLGKLVIRRRLANLSEILFACAYPLLMPQQYGFLASFGVEQKHPCVLVAETVRSLDRYFPEECNGVAMEDIGVDANGHLWFFDSRITQMKMPPEITPYKTLWSTDETGVWLGNLGVTADGHNVFLDRSDHGHPMRILDGNCNIRGGSSCTDEQTVQISQDLFSLYRTAWEAVNAKKGGKKNGTRSRIKPQ